MKWWILGLLIWANFAAAEELTRIRAILVADTANAVQRADDISTECAMNLQELKNLFEAAFDGEADRYTVEVIEGPEASPEAVRQKIAALPAVQPTEGLYFYYCGHGAWDPNEGPFLTFGRGGNILQAEIRHLLLKKNPGAIHMVVEACSVKQGIELAPKAPAPDWKAFRNLLLGSKGVFHVTAASYREAAHMNQSGGLFTNAYVSTMITDPKTLDSDQNGYTWDDILRNIRMLVAEEIPRQQQALVRANRLQAGVPLTQVPYAFLMGAPINSLDYRKYIHFQNQTSEQLTINMNYTTVVNNQWQKAQMSTTVQPGFSARLQDANGQPVIAYDVTWTITGSQSGTTYEDRTRQIGLGGYVRQNPNDLDDYSFLVPPTM